jgi:hypothetical protein
MFTLRAAYLIRVAHNWGEVLIMAAARVRPRIKKRK